MSSICSIFGGLGHAKEKPDPKRYFLTNLIRYPNEPPFTGWRIDCASDDVSDIRSHPLELRYELGTVKPVL